MIALTPSIERTRPPVTGAAFGAATVLTVRDAPPRAATARGAFTAVLQALREARGWSYAACLRSNPVDGLLITVALNANGRDALVLSPALEGETR